MWQKTRQSFTDQFFIMSGNHCPPTGWDSEQKGDLNATTKTVGSPFVSTMG